MTIIRRNMHKLLDNIKHKCYTAFVIKMKGTTMTKNKKSKANDAPVRPSIPVDSWYGVGLLFVAISVGYANYIVFFGTDGVVPKVMLLPSTIAVGLFLVYKAFK